MIGALKAIWRRLAGGAEIGNTAEAGPAVEYNGYSIRPAPYPAEGQYQTAGFIIKEFPDGTKEHRFIRAEKHASKDVAAEFAVSKAKQIIDELGDRIFAER
jgi:hypothetical protein